MAIKKYLNEVGATYILNILKNNYPDNEVLTTCINTIQDVLDDKVNKTDIANSITAGVVKVDDSYGGIGINNGIINIVPASSLLIKTGTQYNGAIVPAKQHESIFYGLAKAAGDTTQSASSNTVGTYTDNAKAAIKAMLGTNDNLAPIESTSTASTNYAINDVLVYNGLLYKVTQVIATGETITPGTNVELTTVSAELDTKVDDVTVNGTSVVANGVANIPIAANSGSYGLVKIYEPDGVYVNSSGTLSISKASDRDYKTGSTNYRVVTPYNQHQSVFYGLAKAAGDITQSQSTNAVGTYTAEAKSAIRNMLGVDASADIVAVSGTDPIITGISNTRYLCGEVYTLSIVPPAHGIIDIVFTSGSTVTVLTLPNTVKMPEWFEIETNRVYEINILDGVYGSVMSWPVL